MKSSFHDGELCLVFTEIDTVKSKNDNVLNQMITIYTCPLERERQRG